MKGIAVLTIGNDLIGLTISPDGLRIEVTDRRRGTAWQLDTSRWGYATEAMHEAFANPVSYSLTPFSAGRAVKVNERQIDVTYPLPDGEARCSWSLLPDGIEIRLSARSQQVQRLSHPGNFVPARGEVQMLIPHQQGMLLRNVGATEHHRYTMDRYAMLNMLGYLTGNAGLLLTQEDLRDRCINCGKDERGIYGLVDVMPCAVEGWYEHIARLYPTEGTITAVCKRYRNRLIERGMFVSWDRKIARKPIVEKLFGALLAFVGYNQARHTDYVAGARRLKAMGFDTVFYYPVRFNIWVPGTKMGGDAPLDLPEADLEAIEAVGGVVAPWTYTYDALDSKSPELLDGYATDSQGKRRLGWKMDDNEFYRVCTGHQIDWVRRQWQGRMKRMGWVHYDVSAVIGGMPCFKKEHAIHRGKALTARDDQRLVGQLLGPEVNGNRVVSSEGFNEFAAQFYDLGSNKAPARCGEQQYTPVPLTMLVLHDSTIHNWWEIHVYNDISQHYIGKRQEEQANPNKSKLHAATDALYGCPPLVFPFGRQYGWVKDVWGPTFSYEVSLDEPAVQEALRAALPVTRLHKKIGRCEMVSFDMLTPDAAVQTTLFSDGTRVVANLSDTERRTSEFGVLAAYSWKTTS